MDKSNIDYSKLSFCERITLTEQIYISYPRLNRLSQRLSYCHQYSKYSSEPECLFIKGPTGCGKTTLYKQYEVQFPRKETLQGTEVSVLSASIPVPATIKGLVTTLLFNIGDPIAEKGTILSQTLRLEKLIKICKVEMIILDEFQHIIDRDSQKILQTVSDWLKNLLNNTNVPMVLIGMPGSDIILDANAQLKRRFSAREILEPFGWSTEDEREEFRTLLYTIESKLPLTKKSNLSDLEMAFRFYYASDGVVAYVMKIIRNATAKSLMVRQEHLTLEVLSQTYDEVIGANNPKKRNPFSTDVNWLVEEPVNFPISVTTSKRVKAKSNKPRFSKIVS